MIDNFDQISQLLKFDNENEFYFLQVLQRKKDHKEGQILGSDNNSRLIRAYYIYSIEQLLKYKQEIVELCKLFNARAGISLNRRNNRVISLEMIKLLADNIKNDHFKQLGGLYNTVCGQYHQEKDKTWIIDIDHKNRREINDILRFIETDCKPDGNKFVALVESRSGFHLITRAFDSKVFGDKYPDIEIHKNNPTNLYIV